MILLSILLIPLLIPFIAKLVFKNTICWKELGLNVLIVLVIITIGYQASISYQGWDNEILNGEVVKKQSEHVSCSHSYPCRCRAVTTGKTISTHCDTCYWHLYDIDWNLYTNMGDTLSINRIDAQGVREPARFTTAKVGDPVAVKKSYMNYIKAAPDSLFHFNKILSEKYVIPEYPLAIYDYHYINRVLAVGVAIPSQDKWNVKLANRLKVLGIKKEVNIILVFVKAPHGYYVALQNNWLGGKKNDVVVVVGVNDYPVIDWVEVMSWTNNELYKVQLRDDLLSMGKVDLKMLDIITEHTAKDFKRRDLSDFDYLKDEIEAPLWVIVILFFVGIGLSLCLSWFFHKNKTF